MKEVAFILALLLLMPFSLGATIHGKVFDYNFALAKNSVVKINTVPEQVVVAVDGAYSFNVPIGEYALSAELKDEFGRIAYSLNDQISVANEGIYVRDLIMFPNNDLSELELENNVSAPSLSDDAKGDSKKPILMITGIILVIIFALLYCVAFKKCKLKDKLFKKESEKQKEAEAPITETAEAKTTPVIEEPDELAKLAGFIKSHKRATQKDIRKQIPLSEAKISLMLTDLESQGKIRKIKKGRGNIIIWDEK